MIFWLCLLLYCLLGVVWVMSTPRVLQSLKVIQHFKPVAIAIFVLVWPCFFIIQVLVWLSYLSEWLSKLGKK
jgi:hypothetical protein